MRGRLVAGNWKCNGDLASNQQLLNRLRTDAATFAGVTCAVCVPFPYLQQTQQLLTGTTVTWGAQDVSQFGAGAYTGAVTGAMLREFGSVYAIVGHSERRSIFGETDAVVAAKFKAALHAQLTPILCVGETLEQRESGAMESVVRSQINAITDAAGISALSNAIVAYEPVWAIGTGKTASPEQAQAAHRFIRDRIAQQDADVASGLRILYGGSVKASNAGELFAMPDIDGGLIGGASLIADEFVSICRAAQAH
jgi:triosephosphate isomerase